MERITTNLKYTIKDSIDQSLWSTPKSSDYDYFDSICSETMVGFWQTKGQSQSTINCVIGKQIQQDNDFVLDEEKSTDTQSYFRT